MSEIKIMSFGFPPKGWAQCNGQLMPISQNQALFSLLGTNFGGDGRTTFALPNLQGRNPMHMGGGHTLGEPGGEAAHTLNMSEMPQHTHTAYAANVASTSGSPSGGRALSQSKGANLYAAATNLTTMAPNALGNVGGSQAHPNMQPYLVLNFCIALQGIFPSQT